MCLFVDEGNSVLVVFRLRSVKFPVAHLRTILLVASGVSGIKCVHAVLKGHGCWGFLCVSFVWEMT